MFSRKIIVFFVLCTAITFAGSTLIYLSKGSQAYINENYCYTLPAEAICESIYATDNDGLYRITYSYIPDKNNGTPYYTRFLESSRNPTTDVLYVNANDYTKVSKVRSTHIDIIKYLMSRPDFEILVMLVWGVFIISAFIINLLKHKM